MSGFLDKKVRLIDFKLTTTGLKLMNTSKVTFDFSTVSDKSIVYDDFGSNDNLRKISSSEGRFIAFDSTTNLSSNEVFNIDSLLLDYKDYSYNSFSRIEKILSKKSLASKNKIFKDEELKFKYSFMPDVFDFGNDKFKRYYPTVQKASVDKSELIRATSDYKLKDKTSLLYLPPIDSVTKDVVKETYDESVRFKCDSIFNILKSFDYTKQDNIENIVEFLEKNNKIHKFTFTLDKVKNDEIYIVDFEQVFDNGNKNLVAIKLGNITSKTNKIKKVYAVGKFTSKGTVLSENASNHFQRLSYGQETLENNLEFEDKKYKDVSEISDFKFIDQAANSNVSSRLIGLSFVFMFTMVIEWVFTFQTWIESFCFMKILVFIK